jgi:hypothetical protein
MVTGGLFSGKPCRPAPILHWEERGEPAGRILVDFELLDIHTLMRRICKLVERPAAVPRDPVRPSRFSSPDSIAKSLWAGILVLGIALLPQHVAAADIAVRMSASIGASVVPRGAPARSLKETPSDVEGDRHHAYFGSTQSSRDARQIADWIVDSADNLGLPFVIVDKTDARVFVFDAGGRLQGAAPALLGLARGDDTVPGIGDREFSDMPPETRTTPAGRFVASLGMDTRNEDVLWVDYEAAVSLHRVVTSNAKERRLERLATPTPRDNRISYGCINVPKRFYENVVSPAFTGTDGIVYVLPETRTARAVFGSYDVDERMRYQYAVQPPQNASIVGALSTQQ